MDPGLGDGLTDCVRVFFFAVSVVNESAESSAFSTFCQQLLHSGSWQQQKENVRMMVTAALFDDGDCVVCEA